MCQSIVAAHGGEISVESERGRGTTFRVSLQAFGQGARAGGETAPRLEYLDTPSAPVPLPSVEYELKPAGTDAPSKEAG